MKCCDAVKGYIFDYGGTLDTGGCHWGKMLWHAYERVGVPVTETMFREAYVHAERMLGRNAIISQDDTFRQTLSKKIELELEYLLMAYGFLRSAGAQASKLGVQFVVYGLSYRFSMISCGAIFL